MLDLLLTTTALTSDEDHMEGWQWVMMAVFATLFATLLVTAIWALVNYGRDRAGQRRASPEELLAVRYARGDITTEEYQERLDTLRR